MLDSVIAGNQLVNLMPLHTKSWWPIVEDIFASKACKAQMDAMVRQAIAHQEFLSLSMDGTFKVCMPLLGQAKFSDPLAKRNSAAFDDASSYFRVITVRGRTGAVLAMFPTHGEGAVELKEGLAQAFPVEGLEQVRHVATDCPSGKLLEELRLIMPALQGLSLDPTHLAMKFEEAKGKIRTQSTSALRMLLRKFSAVDGAIKDSVWGPFFTGESRLSLTAPEKVLREHILSGEMPKKKAGEILNRAMGQTVWLTRHDYIESLAALSSAFRDDVAKKLPKSGKKLNHIFWSSVTPENVEWLFNNLRFKHSLTPAQQLLLPSGTTSNEALHAEINNWFRQIQAIHRSTLRLKLQVVVHAKLLSHTTALYSPTARQMPAAHVLARRLGQPLWLKTEWLKHCTDNAPLPLRHQYLEDQQVIKSHAVCKKPALQTYKRPAVHRTVSTLKRRAGISRAGTSKRPKI